MACRNGQERREKRVIVRALNSGEAEENERACMVPGFLSEMDSTYSRQFQREGWHYCEI